MLSQKYDYSDTTKKFRFGIFIIPIVISFCCIFLIKRHPLPIAILLVSFGITIIIISLFISYAGLKINKYIQKNDFQTWKKLHSTSLRERRDAAKTVKIMSSQIPQLEEFKTKGDKIAFTLLMIWTVIFIGIISFIIFKELY